MTDSGLPFNVATFLSEPLRPAQVSAVSPTGAPLLGSLWFLYDDGRFWFTSRLQSPLLHAMTSGSEVAVIVDQFDPPEFIRQVRVRGSGRIEPHDPARVEAIYRRYLGNEAESWPPPLRAGLTDPEFALWAVRPSSGLVVAFPEFKAREVRWSATDPSPLP